MAYQVEAIPMTLGHFQGQFTTIPVNVTFPTDVQQFTSSLQQ